MLREALTLDRLQMMTADDAAAYFVAHGAEGLTSNEQELMGEWLTQSDAHAAALDNANRAWDSFRDADGNEILEAMRIHALAPSQGHQSTWLRVAAGVAAIFLLVTVSLLVLPRLDRSPQTGGEGTVVEYASSPTGIREVDLPDGSHLTLDANSAVRARFAASERVVRLVRGRGYFDVQHDQSRPFAVIAANRRIVDIGTRFDVSVADGALHVVLEEGRLSLVSLKAGVSAVILKPGEEFIERSEATVVRTAGNPATIADWRHGLIRLDDTPLADAIATMNRYSTTQIVVRDPAVAKIRISGQFRSGDAERFAQTVADLHALCIASTGNRIVLGPKK